MGSLKFVADVNVEKGIVDFLRAEGYDVKWVPNIHCEIADESLLRLAHKERRILITNDKDFGELTFLQIQKVLKDHRDKLPNHFVVVNRTKFRFIPMERIR